MRKLKFWKKFLPPIAVSVLLSALTVSNLSCSGETEERISPDGPPPVVSVFVNIPPQGYFVRRIGGERVNVEVLVPPGSDPHGFYPTPRQVMRLGAADLYFHGIMPFGKALAERVADSGAGVKVIDITRGIELRRMDESGHHEEAHSHSRHNDCGHGHHHAEHAHDHHGDGRDPHVWLSPPEIRVQVRNIAGALVDADPEFAPLYEENRDQFLAEIDRVHDRLQEVLAPYHGRTFYVFHPAFGYFARSYGMVEKAVETGGKSPGARHLRELIRQANQEGVRVIFVQPQFESRSAATIADAIDGVVLPLDPLAENVMENLLHIGEQIEKALGQ